MRTDGLLVERLTKRFGKHLALDDVAFRVPKGGFVVLLGPAGAGKTTTMRCIAGLEEPEEGAIALDGLPLDGLEPRARDVAMIFDNLALYPNKTGFQNIASPLLLRGLPRETVEERVRAVAGKLAIGHVLGRLPRTMSGGERQRIALARALVRDPALFLLDEPLSSLDAMLRVELRAELRRIQRENGATFLLATPDFVEALALADTIVVLMEGRVRQIGSPQEIYDAPADRAVARFVGAPEINLVPAGLDTGRLRLLDTTFPAPIALAKGLGTRTGFEAGLRPEDLTIGPPRAGAAEAILTDIEPLGVRAALTFEAAGLEIRASVPAAQARGLSTGERLGLAPRLERLLAFDAASGRSLPRSTE